MLMGVVLHTSPTVWAADCLDFCRWLSTCPHVVPEGGATDLFCL